MKTAHIERTVDGINVFISEETQDIRLFFENLGGIVRAGKTFFWDMDSKDVPECLKDEGYKITRSNQNGEWS